MAASRVPISGQASLFGRSIAIVMASALFAALIISITAYQVLIREILDQSSGALSRNTAYHAEMIHRDLLQRKTQLGVYAQSLLDDQGRLLPGPALTERLREQPRLGGLFSDGLVVIDPNGVAIAESIPVPDRIGTRYRDRPHIQAMIDDPQSSIAGPFIGRRTGLPLISFQAPILAPDQTLQGILTGILDLTDPVFYELTANPLPIKKSQRLYIFDLNNGYAIRHPELPTGIQPLPDPAEDAVVRHIIQEAGDRVVTLSNDESVLVTRSPLDLLGWTLVSVASYDEVAQTALTSLWRFVWASLATLAVVVLVALWLVYRNLRPLNDSTRAIERMVEQTDSHTRLPESNLVEIRRLNSAFNQLMEVRQRYESELEHEKDRFFSLFDQSTNALVLLKPERWTIEMINDAGRRALGLEPGNVQGRTLTDCVGISEDNLATIRTVPQDGQSVRGLNWTLSHEDMSVSIYEVSAGLVSASTGQSVMLSLRDVTESTQLQKAKDEFISTVSHELRTPLTSLSGSIKLLEANVIGHLPDSAKPVLNIALKNCDRLETLVNDLLDANRLMTGRMSFQFGWHSVAELVEEAVHSSQALAVTRGIDLVCEQPRDDREIHVDPVRFRQILDNLISNAIKFGPQRSQVRVTIQHDSYNSRVEVIDQGPGVPDAFRDRIFKRFSQADASSRRAQEGTGLGLSICRELTDHMDGRIDFDRARFVGACFYVVFPSRPVQAIDDASTEYSDNRSTGYGP